MMTPFPQSYFADQDGDVPPVLGGALAAKEYAFTFATTAATVAFTLPAGATICSFDLVVNTVFNNTPLLSVGSTGVASSATYYMNARAVLATAGPVFSVLWDTSGKWWTKLYAPEPITITLGGTPDAGAAVLVCRYIMK